MGDIVLLKALTEARSKHVKHELTEIVYKVGRVVDPLTGKKVAGTEFVEPLTDLPLGLDEDATLTEKLQQLNISAASSAADAPPAQTPTSWWKIFYEVMLADQMLLCNSLSVSVWCFCKYKMYEIISLNTFSSPAAQDTFLRNLQ